MKRKAAQVALSRLIDGSSFPRFSKINVCNTDDKSRDPVVKSTTQQKAKPRETRSMTRQKTRTNLSMAGGIEKDLSGGKRGASSRIRKSPRTTNIAGGCSSVADHVSSEEMDAESKEEDDEEENDVKPCKMRKTGNSFFSATYH